jgi:hypothetical protein
MASSDRHSVGTASFGVLLVAITAAVISFSHVRTVAVRAGETELTSWLLPVSIDGAVVAAVSVLLADSRAGRRTSALTWLLLGLGLTASLAANVASAEPTATARAVAAWPPLALVLGIEVLAGLARRSNASRRSGHADVRPWAASVGLESRAGDRSGGVGQHVRPAAGTFGILPVQKPTNGNGHRQRPLDDGHAVRVIRQLDSDSASGRVSRLQIQKVLGCGGSRAARLAELARQPGGDPHQPDVATRGSAIEDLPAD